MTALISGPRGRRCLALVALSLVLAAAAARANESAAPFTPDQLRTEIEALLAATEAESQPAALAAATKRLRAAWPVRAGQDVLLMPTDWLRAELDELRFKPTPELRERIQTQLRRLIADLDAYGGPQTDRTRDRRALRAILARREFSAVHGPTWLDRMRRRVAEYLASLVDAIFGSSSFPVVAALVVYALMGLAVLVVGLWILRTLSGGQRQQAVPAHIAVSAKPWTVWLSEAREAAAAGRWRDAVRLAYWAGIACLESRGVWPPDRARTPREYLRLLPASSEHRPALKALTQTFEPVWYGGRIADGTTFERAIGDLARLGAVWSGASPERERPGDREKA